LVENVQVPREIRAIFPLRSGVKAEQAVLRTPVVSTICELHRAHRTIPMPSQPSGSATEREEDPDVFRRDHPRYAATLGLLKL
jgi:hypothetical protein